MKTEKNALITGGTRGIGFGIAGKLQEEGYTIAVNGVREENDVTTELEELKKKGKVVYCPGNVGSKEGRASIIQKAFEELGVIQVLVNNAGVGSSRKDILDITEEDFDRVMDVNLKGTFFLSQEVARRMVDAGKKDGGFKGCIVNISSVSASVASVKRAEYCISKAGVSMLTKVMAIRMSPFNIPVYEIQPGVIETDMIEAVRDKYTELIEGGLTLEKRFGTPEDIGKIVAALARGDLPYSTGQTLTPDGGLMIRRF